MGVIQYPITAYQGLYRSWKTWNVMELCKLVFVSHRFVKDQKSATPACEQYFFSFRGSKRC